MGNYTDTKTYVVAWINFFDGVLHQEQVQALNAYHAVELSDIDFLIPEDFHTYVKMEDLQLEAFNRDAMFSVLEIKC